MPATALIGGGMSLAGGAAGQIASSGDKDRTNAAIDAAVGALGNYKISPAERLKLEKYIQAERIAADLEQQVQLDPSKAAEIKQNQDYINMQKNALMKYRLMSEQGLSPQARMEARLLQQDLGQTMAADRDAAMQRLQMSGMGDSGTARAAMIAGGQGAANRAARSADQIAARSDEARNTALSQMSGLAGTMGQNQLSAEQAAAGASDKFAFQRANMLTDTQRENINRLNAVKQFNATTAQDVSNRNVQQQFDAEKAYQDQRLARDKMDLDRVTALSTAQTRAADMYGQRATATAQAYANMGSGASQSVGSYNAAMDKKGGR